MATGYRRVDAAATATTVVVVVVVAVVVAAAAAAVVVDHENALYRPVAGQIQQ